VAGIQAGMEKSQKKEVVKKGKDQELVLIALVQW